MDSEYNTESTTQNVDGHFFQYKKTIQAENETNLYKYLT